MEYGNSVKWASQLHHVSIKTSVLVAQTYCGCFNHVLNLMAVFQLPIVHKKFSHFSFYSCNVEIMSRCQKCVSAGNVASAYAAVVWFFCQQYKALFPQWLHVALYCMVIASKSPLRCTMRSHSTAQRFVAVLRDTWRVSAGFTRQTSQHIMQHSAMEIHRHSPHNTVYVETMLKLECS